MMRQTSWDAMDLVLDEKVDERAEGGKEPGESE